MIALNKIKVVEMSLYSSSSFFFSLIFETPFPLDNYWSHIVEEHFCGHNLKYDLFRHGHNLKNINEFLNCCV